MNNRSVPWQIITLLFAIITHNTSAAEPPSIPLGGMDFIPTLSLSEEYDDNVWNSPTVLNSSWVTRIAPKFVLKAQERSNIYQLNYGLTHENVASSHDDDHTDHDISATAHLEFDSRNRIDLYATYQDLKARRDSTNNFNGESGNETNSTNIGADYGFGTTGSKGQLEFGTQYGWLRYDNNFNEGSLTRERERDVLDLNAVFYYQILPKTRLLAELEYHDYDYISSTSPLDSNSQIFQLGLTWEATAKTTGEIKIGVERKEFALNSSKSVHNPSWDASITWNPKSYSTFTVSSKSTIDEGSATENHIETILTSLTWEHSWTADLNSYINYSYSTKEYFGSTNAGREDDIDNFGIGVIYKLKRWVDISLDYQYDNTDSNDPIAAYDRNVIGISVNLSL